MLHRPVNPQPNCIEHMFDTQRPGRPEEGAATLRRMGTLRSVDLAWLDSAPVRCTKSRALHHPPAAVFAAIAGDPGGWGRWFPGFDDSGHYTDEAPHGTGSVRKVRVGGVTVTERVLAWDEPSRWAFCAESTGIPSFAALAEDYRLAPTSDGSLLTWTFAVDPGRMPRVVFAPLPMVIERLMQRFCTNLDRVLDRPGAATNSSED